MLIPHNIGKGKDKEEEEMCFIVKPILYLGEIIQQNGLEKFAIEGRIDKMERV